MSFIAIVGLKYICHYLLINIQGSWKWNVSYVAPLHEIHIAYRDIEYICGTSNWINMFAIWLHGTEKSAGFNEAYSKLEVGYNSKNVMLLLMGTAMKIKLCWKRRKPDLPPETWIPLNIAIIIQSNSKLLSGFPCPVIFKPDVPRKACILKLFSILHYWFYK
jgi:hypothetical protein